MYSPETSAATVSPTRRRFLGRLTVILGALAAAVVSIPAIGFVIAPARRRAPNDWRRVGPLSRFPLGETVAVRLDDATRPWSGDASRVAAWVRRTGRESFVAFSANCTHLGCPVRWVADAKLFLCPCHGGVYDESGLVQAGPPPQPLARYEVTTEGGDLLIRAASLPLA